MAPTPDESEQDTDFPSIEWQEEEASTRPIPVHQTTAGTRRDRHVELIAGRHMRIASAIETMWGHPECTEYIQQLIISGYKEGERRVGFRNEVLQALLVLGDLHDQEHPHLKADIQWTKKGANSAL